MDNNESSGILTDRDVTEHTAGMWKYNPVPESPEPFPETSCVELSDKTFGVCAASVRGKKHKHDGSNRDDSYAVRISDEWTAVAVSDGAGSKLFSRIGAEAACSTAVEYINKELSALKERMPEYRKFLGKAIDSADFGAVCSEIAAILRESFTRSFMSVEAACEKRKVLPEFIEAAGREPDIKDFSCTLLTALVIPVDTENGSEFLPPPFRWETV